MATGANINYAYNFTCGDEDFFYEYLTWNNIKPCYFCGNDNIEFVWKNPVCQKMDIEDIFLKKIVKNISVCHKCYYSGIINRIYCMNGLKKYVPRHVQKRINVEGSKLTGLTIYK